MGQYECSSRHLLNYRSILLLLWAMILVQALYSSIRYATDRSQSISRYWQPDSKAKTLDSTDNYARPRSTSSSIDNQQLIEFAQSFEPELLRRRSYGVLFAEAGKKKKKSKSEVVVISVQNPPSKSAMYPVFIPSCGGHHGGHYGRRKRAIPGLRR